MSGKGVRTAAHALLFLLAAALFYLGLELGLHHEPNLVTLLWAASAAIVALNLVWMHRSRG